MNSQFWFYNPKVLFEKNNILELWPNNNMNLNEKLNSITRLIIVLSLLGYLITKNINMIITGILTILSIIILHYFQNNKKNKESFDNLNIFQNNGNYTEPTKKNPMMNVLLPEINDNPNRKSAEPSFVPKVEKNINNKTKEMVLNNFDNSNKLDDRLFKDLGDNFEFDMSMRQWYSTPNTKVMNDQKGFAEFCYGDMISCKEGDPIACTRNTPPHWIN